MNLYTAPTITVGTPVTATVLSLEKDRVVFYHPSHTLAEPRLIVVRRFPSSGGAKGRAQYSITAVRGKLNADGSQRSGNINASLGLIIPDDCSALTTELSDTQNDLQGFLLNSGVMTAIRTLGVIPTS